MARKLPVALFLLILAATVSVAAEIKVATLNCFLLFDPRIDHRGKLDDEQRQAYESLYEGGFKAPDVPIAGIASDVPMQPMDYARFFGTIAGFMVLFYAIAAVMKR